MRYLTIPILMFCLSLPITALAVYEIGDTVQEFSLADLAGNPVSLLDFQGDVILITFFATWCVNCAEESEIVEQLLWEVYRDQGLTVIAIDVGGRLPLVKGWVLAHELTYPVWFGADWPLVELFEPFPNVPFNVVLDRNLRLRYKQIGFDQTAITDLITDILADVTPAEHFSWGAVKAMFR